MVRETQTKIAMRHHHTPVRMADNLKSKALRTPNAGEDVKHRGCDLSQSSALGAQGGLCWPSSPSTAQVSLHGCCWPETLHQHCPSPERPQWTLDLSPWATLPDTALWSCCLRREGPISASVLSLGRVTFSGGSTASSWFCRCSLLMIMAHMNTI